MSDRTSNSVAIAVIGCLLLVVGVLLGSIGTVLTIRATKQPPTIATQTTPPPAQQAPTIVLATESIAASTKEYPGSVLINIPKDMDPADARLMRNILRKTLDSGEWEEVEWKLTPLEAYEDFALDEKKNTIKVTRPAGREISLQMRLVSPSGKRLHTVRLTIRGERIVIEGTRLLPYEPIDRNDY